MRLDDYTVVSPDQDLPTFGATCALLRWHLRRGPQRLTLSIRHIPMISGQWSMDSYDVQCHEDPIAVPRHHIVMAMN